METTVKRGGLKLSSIRRILKFLQVDPGPARKFVNWFIRHYSRLLEERRVRLTPAMVMLGEDICAHYILLSRRYQLLNRLETEGTKETQGTEDQKGDTSHNCREASQQPGEKSEGKSREASQQPGEKSEGKSRGASQQSDEKGESKVRGPSHGTHGSHKSHLPPTPLLSLPDLKAVGAVFDEILKLRERLRKSIGEFQSVLESAGVDPESALDEFLAGGGFDMDEDTDVSAAPELPSETDGLPLTEIRPDVQAVQPPDATPELVVSPMSTVSTMSTMSTLSTEKESANDDTFLEPARGDSRNAAGRSDARVAGPVRRKAPTGPIRESLVRAWLSSRVARVPSQKEGALLGPGRGQDDRDRDPVRVGVGVPAVPADAGGDAARGAPGPADAAHPEHVRAKPAATGQP